MSTLVPLTVAMPLMAAAVFTIVGRWAPSPLLNAGAIVVAAGEVGICTAVLVGSWRHPLVYWFAAWRVHDGVALGIDFSVTPLGAGLASVVSLIAWGALLHSWGSFRGQEVAHLSYTLMLIFTAGMVGFSLTGDLFNLFVFFEVMSVSAYALTAYQVRQSSVLQGALNFAITNSLAAFAILFGIALVYARTAALNLAQIGVALGRGRSDALVVVAFALIVVGFLVKAGAVPFHFWLSDAYAVAPAAVAALLTGIMSDLGYHAIAKVYWTAFSGALAPDAVRSVLVGIGVASALVGAAMAFLQADMKRLVAFATVANGGITLVGIGVLSPRGLAGSTALVVALGLVRAAAILGIGVCVFLLGGSDEQLLHGRGRRRRFVPLAGVFVLCAVGFAALPPFGPFLGKGLVDGAAEAAGLGWVPALLSISTGLVAAALLRAGGRVFLGLGARRDPLLAGQPDEPQEGEPGDDPSPHQAPMLVPAYVFLAVALGASLVPTLAGRTLQTASLGVDRRVYAAEVLHGRREPGPNRTPSVRPRPDEYLYAAGSGALALVGAALMLSRRRVPRPVHAAAEALHTVHNGAIGDYVTWFAVGAAAVAVTWLFTLT